MPAPGAIVAVLSFISCFGIIIVVVLNIFDDKKLRLISFGCVLLSIVIYIVLSLGLFNKKFETYEKINIRSLNLSGKISITFFSANDNEYAGITSQDDDSITIKLTGKEHGHYSFTLVFIYLLF